MVGLGKRERAEEDGVDEGEDGGGGADAEGEGEDGKGGEAGMLAELAEGETEVLGEEVHERSLGYSERRAVVGSR